MAPAAASSSPRRGWATLVLLASLVCAINNGLASTPPMGLNSWTSAGESVSAKFLMAMGDALVATGLASAGYMLVCSDDGWSTGSRNASSGRIVADPTKFPNGFQEVTTHLHAAGLQAGIYSSASSVVCSGRPGSLYNEYLDAATFAEWEVDYVKYDSCGEYSLGSRRFDVFADAVAATGRSMVISTEPFALFPNPSHGGFSHLWRTGNDINSNWGTIIDRIDRNAKWAPFAGPSRWNDPDMLQVGNGGLTIEEDRAHFGLWALSKSPLILGSDVTKLTAPQLAVLKNGAVIGVNQDAVGVQARKLAVNGSLIPLFVGVASCYGAAGGGASPGFNGVSPPSFLWNVSSLGSVNGTAAYALVNRETGRCLGLRTYAGRANVPLLVPCASPSLDLTLAWAFPTGLTRIGGVQSIAALVAGASATVLSVENSTWQGAVHGKDGVPLLDASYGITVLALAAYAPEPLCKSRNCQDYDPAQSWYYRQSTGE